MLNIIDDEDATYYCKLWPGCAVWRSDLGSDQMSSDVGSELMMKIQQELDEIQSDENQRCRL